MKSLVYLMITSMALTGCSVTLPTDLEQKHQSLIASNWKHGQGFETDRALREPPSIWWKRWDNATLSFLVSKTLENNTDIAIATANLRSAQAALTRAKSNLWPSANLGGNATDRWQNHDWTQSYSAETSASWSLSFGGREWSEYSASKASSKAKYLDLEDTQSAMTSEVAKTYILLCQAHEQVRILHQTLRSYEEGKNLAQWRYQAGLVSVVDAEQANASFESMKAQIATAEHTVFAYQTALARMTVLPLSEIQSLPLSPMPEAPKDIAVSIPAETLSLRPDVLAAREEVVAALYNVRAAKADFFPTLSLTGSFGTAAATVGALGASGTGIGALIGALSMPILNWGDAVAGTEVQKAALDSAQAQYTLTIMKALEETENALSLVRTAQKRYVSLARAQQSSQLTAKIALQQYSSGLTDYQTVLTTQRSWLSAQEVFNSNKAQLAQAYIDLYRALGGGWTPTEDIKDN